MAASVVMARAFLEIAESRGVARARLLARAGIAEERLIDPLERLSTHDFGALAVAAIELTGEEALGLHLGASANESAFDVVAHLAAHAPTLRAAIDACLRFQALLLDDGPVIELTLRADVATLACSFPETLDPRARRLLAELTMSGFQRLVGAGVRRVFFEHERPAHHAAYAAVFGGRETFARGRTAMELDRSVLDTPRVLHHASLYNALSGVATRALEAREATFGGRLRRELRAKPRASMDECARALGISVRSLRRRLAEEQLSYRDLARDALEARATEMLRDERRSAKEVAYMLGFADTSAFQRAFKKWRGVTPKACRESAEARPALRLAEERDA
jgi:AraC-like DNA-binding protein